MGIYDSSKTIFDLYDIAIKQEHIRTFDQAMDFANKFWFKNQEWCNLEYYVPHEISNQRISSKPRVIAGPSIFRHSEPAKSQA